MLRFRLPVLVVTAVVAALLAVPAGAAPANVDVSQRHLNESEEAIAVNPTNPSNIVIFTNVGHREAGLSAGMLLGVSFDGGRTWTRKLIGLLAGASAAIRVAAPVCGDRDGETPCVSR